jgi:hypothetical protein
LTKDQLFEFDQNMQAQPEDVRETAEQKLQDAAALAFQAQLTELGIAFKFGRRGGTIIYNFIDDNPQLGLDKRCEQDLFSAYASCQANNLFAEMQIDIDAEVAAANAPPPPSQDQINEEKAPSRIKVESGMVSQYQEENAAITEEAFHDLRTMDLKQLRQQAIGDRRSRIPDHQRRALDRGDRQWNG